ncbi:uncharacterized protein DS421_10g310440 [Arachis hypogaea]|nr:uncharacterized protein DS421_10g310440 [Arachis hypogaea]
MERERERGSAEGGVAVSCGRVVVAVLGDPRTERARTGWRTALLSPSLELPREKRRKGHCLAPSPSCLAAAAVSSRCPRRRAIITPWVYSVREQS